MAIVGFYWFAFWGTVLMWLWCLFDLCQKKFIRASIWFCTGFGMMAWWMSDQEWTFDDWLGLSIWTVGSVIVLTIVAKVLWWNYKRNRALQSVPPFGTLPETTGNVIPFVKATRDERERVMRIQGHRCANPYCNTDLRQSTPHWDHIVPRSQGGTDSVHNMQWLCDTCNLNKNDMNWLEFLYRYATGLGIDPNVNQKPWQNWVLTRTENGLQCQG
jgi:hypothetical protein